MTFYQTILQQLGGNKFVTMTGANTMTFDNVKKSFTFKIMKNAKKVTHVQITLNSRDLYDIEYFNIRGMNMKTINTSTDVGAASLRKDFETNTGLHTTL